MAQTPVSRASTDIGENLGCDLDPHPQAPNGALIKRVSVASQYVGEEEYLFLASGSLAAGASYASASNAIVVPYQDLLTYTDSGVFDLYMSKDNITFTKIIRIVPGILFRLNVSGQVSVQIKNSSSGNCNYYATLIK